MPQSAVFLIFYYFFNVDKQINNELISLNIFQNIYEKYLLEKIGIDYCI